MRTVGIIAEYNPFHTGHEYHLRAAREAAGADYAVVVMSPDYVQRGEPALFDKYTRTRMALLGGADLVLELPVCYAAGSAEYFAQGAAALLDGLGVIDALCFGGESDNAQMFLQTAAILEEEPPQYVQQLRGLLKQGKTYPQARCGALLAYFTDTTDFLSQPNNILGVEYCRALRRLRSPVMPLPIKRTGSRYNSSALCGPYCSATAIRSGIESGSNDETVFKYIPESSRELFAASLERTVACEDFLPYLIQKLLSGDRFDHILDISSDLSDRICRLRYGLIGKTYREITEALKTKQITESRIRRALLHLILGIKTEAVEGFRQNGTVSYARVLGFRRESAPLLHHIKQNGRLVLISRTSYASRLLTDSHARQMWEQDLFASHLYRSVQAYRHGVSFFTEYEQSPIIL